MHKGGHERRFYPNASLLQTPSCLPSQDNRQREIGVGSLPDALQELSESRVELLGGFQVRQVARTGYGHVAGTGYLCGHSTHDLGSGNAVFLPSDDEGRDAYLAEKRGRIRTLPHGAEGGDGAVRGVI